MATTASLQIRCPRCSGAIVTITRTVPTKEGATRVCRCGVCMQVFSVRTRDGDPPEKYVYHTRETREETVKVTVEKPAENPIVARNGGVPQDMTGKTARVERTWTQPGLREIPRAKAGEPAVESVSANKPETPGNADAEPETDDVQVGAHVDLSGTAGDVDATVEEQSTSDENEDGGEVDDSDGDVVQESSEPATETVSEADEAVVQVEADGTDDEIEAEALPAIPRRKRGRPRKNDD